MAYAHKFDISLIPRVLSDSDPQEAGLSPGISTRGLSSVRRRDMPEEGILRAFLHHRDNPVHVVEIATEANLEFDEALKGVLRLVARGELSLRERDTVANDHLVALTSRGEDALSRSSG